MDRRAAVGAALLALLAACASGPEAWEPAWTGPYQTLSVNGRLDLARARLALEEGRLEQAQQDLRELLEAQPDQLDVAVLLQDVELALLASGRGDGGAAALADPEGALEQLYLDRAEAGATVVGLVLAARAARDPQLRLDLLTQVIELDPSCAWAHYGLAHALLQRRSQYRWREARETLETALALDPSHVAARRLESWMLSQEGAVPQATAALERWLIVTEGDPRVGREQRTRARIDLAQLWILDGRVDAARTELRALMGDPVDRSRRLAVLAVAEQEGGDIAAALDAARRAHRADGTSLLPLVQEALMQQYWIGDLAAAAVTWEAVAAASEGSADLGALLQGFRARVALERLGELGEVGGPDGSDQPGFGGLSPVPGGGP